MIGISESTLQRYWRKAVLKEYNFQCALCYNSAVLECHHYIKRRVKILRHDWRNGIALCPDCHKQAHTKKGNQLVENTLGDEKLKYLFDRENINIKDYCRIEGITQSKFLSNMLEDLKEKIK